MEFPPTEFRSDLAESSGDNWTPTRLSANKGRCFQGPIPVGAGFIVSGQEAASLQSDPDVDYGAVVRSYLTAADITDDPQQRPSRWIIDFAQMPLQDANRYPRAIQIVRERVRPFRETVNREGHRLRWWQFGEPRVGLRNAVCNLRTFAVVGAHAKRLSIAVQPIEVLASNACMVFAFDDDYSMGILLSKAHDAWAWAQASTLETRLRYTPSSVFETFPFPDPVTDEQQEAVAEASRRLLARRTEICTTEQIGLTKLYNAVDEGAWTDLKALHRALDEAVVDCYGWPRSVAQDATELVARLTERNREITEGSREYAPFR